MDGLGNTLKITFFAVLIGITLGFLIAVIRSAYDEAHKLGFLSALYKIYLAIVHGTPVPIQFLIICFVVFGSMRIDKILVAVMTFGINSGAYVAEVFRSDIMSIDSGQFGAGRSLGFNYTQIMIYTIVPQAFKSVLPAFCSEFIVLLKGTFVAGYIAIRDLARGTGIIQGRTYSAFMPLITTAIIHLMMVTISTYFVQKLEGRLRSSDH